MRRFTATFVAKSEKKKKSDSCFTHCAVQNFQKQKYDSCVIHVEFQKFIKNAIAALPMVSPKVFFEVLDGCVFKMTLRICLCDL